jgi:hypothetical protein
MTRTGSVSQKRRMVARHQQCKCPLRQGYGWHMQQAVWWCGTSGTIRGGGKPIGVLHVRHCQVLQVRCHRGCIQPHLTGVWWVHEHRCGGQRTEAQRRTEDMFSECATEYRKRFIAWCGGKTSTMGISMRCICHLTATDACGIGDAGIHHGILNSVVKRVE